MARIFTCGLEENNIISNSVIWNAIGGTPTVVTTPVHSGIYAVQFDGGDTINRNLSASVTTGTYFTRIFWRKPSNPAATQNIIAVRDGADLNDSWRLQILSTGVVRLLNVVTGNTVDTAALNNDVYYRLEVRHLLSDTVGELELRLDGVSQGSLTAQDTLATDVRRWYYGNHGFIDDIAINDATGTFQNSFAGDGKIALMEPASDNTMQWEDGATANPSLFSNVDDLPGTPDDATTYNKEDDTVSQVDRMNVSTLPVEVPSNADMILLDMYMRVGSTATTARDITNKIWDEAGVLTNGPLISAAINGWRIASIGPTNEHQVFDLGARTKANVGAFDVGYDNNSVQATRERRITALWVNVEWIEAAGTTFFQTLAAVAVGVAVISDAVIFPKTLAVTAIGVATLTKGIFVTLAATAIGMPALTKGMFKTLAATAVGVPTLATALLSSVTMAATAVGVAVLSKALVFGQTLTAVATGVAGMVTEFIAGSGPALSSFIRKRWIWWS